EVTAHFKVTLIGIDMPPGERAQYEGLTKIIGERVRILTEQYAVPTTPQHSFMRAVTDLAGDNRSDGQAIARAFLAAVSERKQLLSISPAKRAAVATLASAMKVAHGSLVFTETIATAERIADELHDQGLRVDTVHSSQSSGERRSALREFSSRRLDVVVAPKVLDEGIDVPEADLAVIVSASSSRRQMIQRMGRVLRRKADDRLARFAILYLRGTNEDPTSGAHEAFLTEVLGVADTKAYYHLPDQTDAAVADLCAFSRQSVVLPARRPGDPTRTRTTIRTRDDEESAVAFYGVSERGMLQPSVPPPRPPFGVASVLACSGVRSEPARTEPDASIGRRDRIREAFRRSRITPVSRAELREFDSLWDSLARFSDPVLRRAIELQSPVGAMERLAIGLERRIAEIEQAGRRSAAMAEVKQAGRTASAAPQRYERRRPQRTR
ncbi:MAG: hypothetical protein M3011_09035, partial [Actinomycetota bacterium]|nr:hypothetical protein [Actinomycetota bacterium]